jgi:two-component system response regulator PilR (NtrC family)
VLQERVVTPVGGTQEVPIDVRVVAATHQNLRDLVTAGRFRADLYFRLNVIEIKMPPLRQRREDILPLAQHFLAVFAQRMGRDIKGFDQDAAAVLLALPFPGNVRELENVVERAVALETADRITPAYLPDPGSLELFLREPATDRHDELPIAPPLQVDRAVQAIDRWLASGDTTLDAEVLIDRFEKGLIDAALRKSGGNKTEAARLLGFTFRSMRYKLAKYHVAEAAD